MKKRILAILACVLMLINVFAFSACGNKGRWEGVDMEWNSWYKQVKVTVDIPEKVVLGEYFKIKVTTKNISKSNVEYLSGTCCQNKGVNISHVQLNNGDFILNMQHLGHNEDEVKTVIQPGESVEYEEIVYTKYDAYDYPDLPPLGVYDVYLYNGEVYRKAITIVENM